jgi:hypothetical protein
VGGKRNKAQAAQAALKEKQIAQERIELFYSYCHFGFSTGENGIGQAESILPWIGPLQ